MSSDVVAPYRKVVDDYIEPIVARAIQKKAEIQEIEKDAEPSTVLDHLLNETQGAYQIHPIQRCP